METVFTLQFHGRGIKEKRYVKNINVAQKANGTASYKIFTIRIFSSVHKF